MEEFSIEDCIARVKEAFPKSFMYNEAELIVEKKNNVYFRVDNINSELEFKCKVVEYLARPAHKGLTNKWQTHIREGMNKILGTHFTVEELSIIYTYVGIGCNRQKCIAFVNSGYDVNTLKPIVN